MTFEIVNEETFTEARVVHEKLAVWPLDEDIKFIHLLSFCAAWLGLRFLFLSLLLCCEAALRPGVVITPLWEDSSECEAIGRFVGLLSGSVLPAGREIRNP